MASDLDIPCLVCDTLRSEHGDKNHIFSTDGSLTAMKPGPSRKEPPQGGRGPGITEAHTVGLTLRVIETLTQKGILSSQDLLYIFGGQLVKNTGGQPPSAADPDSPRQQG